MPPSHINNNSPLPSSPSLPWQRRPGGPAHRPSNSISNIESNSTNTTPTASPRPFSHLKTASSSSPSTRSFRDSIGPKSTTFQPTHGKQESLSRTKTGTRESKQVESLVTVSGENDFSGRRYVWLKDPEKAFVKAEVLLDENGWLRVRTKDGNEREVHVEETDKVNPAKFDRANDMAKLTHLNEASVVHNLHLRYQSDLIYTYSGLFLVAVNPYCSLPIYNAEHINMYKNRSREEPEPHIFATTDLAFRNMLEMKENQSILVTGESGAGKTENTKKVIQYLASIAPATSTSSNVTTLEQQIIRANPILEAFGNAQTVRNNNSSRFGKFIRIEFGRQGQIAGAFIDWYLLEKSRVVKQNSDERNYHVFYQLLSGANREVREQFLLPESMSLDDWHYTKKSNKHIAGVDDRDEYNYLLDAFRVMGFSEQEQMDILRVIAAVLHIGNLEVLPERRGSDETRLVDIHQAERLCHVLGVPMDQFVKGLLKPKVKAGREWVTQNRNADQVKHSLDALAKSLYERGFGTLVEKVNDKLDVGRSGGDTEGFIGVLDIAGFEIFEENSFEQLCINYTNEKLQQFFNHHMFVLEQEEYAREKIEWKFIDFGHDLQPTIDLIELSNPIGIFSCLDEDCVMPKATDATFTEKLHSLWDKKSPKYKRSLLNQGFMLTHYAATVDYSTEGWLEKNKDPLNDNITKLLANSHHKYLAHLFSDCADDGHDHAVVSKSRIKKGLFRTVAQRHKEQLTSLMNQLNSTHPHFVRCIIPNHQKRPKRLQAPLVLDQLRCNGVLEGIRIARTGFPNRLPFNEFRTRYEVLTPKLPKGYMEGQKACMLMLEALDLDPSYYRVGLTKVFFRAGVLAELEEQRDKLMREIFEKFQAYARGYIVRKLASKRLYRAEASRIIQRNMQVYSDLQKNPWWRLFVRMKPLLGTSNVSSAELKKREEEIEKLAIQVKQEAADKQRLEEERRRAEAELSKIANVLESERALALDKEEIFKRMQQREADLAEKLAGALEDQDDLEDQLDELMLAKKKADEQAEAWRTELEQAGALIRKLEAEKSALAARLEEVERLLAESENRKNERNDVHEKLDEEIKVLKSHLALKERKISDYEKRLLKSDHDLDEKLAKSTGELKTAQKLLREAVEENRTIRQQLADLSATSTDYEDLVRRKESELSILRSDLKKNEINKKVFEDERLHLRSQHDEVRTLLNKVQSEVEILKRQKAQLEREAGEAKRLLEAKISEDQRSGQGRKILDEQIRTLKEQLLAAQDELGKERRERADVLLLSENRLNHLKREHDALLITKNSIEKELFDQQDALRRALEARSNVEKEKRTLVAELNSLRTKFDEHERSRSQVEVEIERSLSRQAREKEASLRKQLESTEEDLSKKSDECSRLAAEVSRLTRVMSEQDSARQTYETSRKRNESELTAVKNRLMASENDNRVLQNKIQQKNLEINKANAKAGDQFRKQIVQLTAEKAKVEENEKKMRKQLSDALVQVSSLEKQKEKLSLDLEDLNHEVNREHKVSRTAEKQTSTLQLQLAEANRQLETERQGKSQAQAQTRQLKVSLEAANSEIAECHNQLLLLQRCFLPPEVEPPASYEASKVNLAQSIDLASKLDSAAAALRTSEERRHRLEQELADMRRRHQHELEDVEAMHNSSKRNLLEEMSTSNAPTQSTPRNSLHKTFEMNQQRFGTPVTPNRRSNNTSSSGIYDSGKSDRTLDTVSFQRRMDQATEIEELENKLQMAEMQNRHLQAQLEKNALYSRNGTRDESPTAKKAKRLERENARLHDMLDDSAEKVSQLEASLRSGELSVRDIQAKSHEELFELLNSQEQARRSLLNVHNSAVNEIAEFRQQIETVRQSKVQLEVELREKRAELDEALSAIEQDKASRQQLLAEFGDLQIRLDAESSKAADLAASLKLYKSRSEEYFNKLEQAEITVLKASRAEAFAKSQCKEAEDTAAEVMAERRQMEGLVEDLQRQNQRNEEKIEDLTADIDAAVQARNRLQNELDDYRNRRAMDLEDKESSMEQTRKKYQAELAALSGELELEREGLVQVRTENRRLRDEVETLRAKWDDEVLNSSTWAKEKARLEVKLQDLAQSHEEAVNAHNDASAKIVSLLSQVRTLRASIDDTTAERDQLHKDKRALEQRLSDATQKLEELAQSTSPSLRNAAKTDRELLDLKAALAKAEDSASTAGEKLRRAEAFAAETQRDIAAEREANVKLHAEKAALEKGIKEMQLKLVDLETKSYSTTSHDVRFLSQRVQELEKQLEAFETQRTRDERSVKNVDRTVRDLQSQIERRDKANSQLSEEISKGKEKIERLLKTIEELQGSESKNQLIARRAEREVREERERCLRLERELEGWKGLRLERHAARSASTAMSVVGGGFRVQRAGSASDGSDIGDDEKGSRFL